MRDRACELGARVVAAADAHVHVVVGRSVGFVARAVVRGVVLRERRLHPLDEATRGVRLRGAAQIADRLERLASAQVIVADDEQRRGLAIFVRSRSVATPSAFVLSHSARPSALAA